MDSMKYVGLVAGYLALAVGTVLVFVVFDRTSHSASDTLRPFLITMAPVWLATAVVTWALLRIRRAA